MREDEVFFQGTQLISGTIRQKFSALMKKQFSSLSAEESFALITKPHGLL